MDEYKVIRPDEEYGMEELREKYNEAIEDIWYLEHRVKELDSDYEGMLDGFLELQYELTVYKARYGELTEEYETLP